MAVTTKEVSRRSYLKRREKILAQKAVYRLKNLETIRAKARAYGQQPSTRSRQAVYMAAYVANPAIKIRLRIEAARYRALRDGLVFSDALYGSLITKPPVHCACCGKVLNYSPGRKSNRDDSPSLDRFDNSVGYTVENTVVVCFRCNWLKSNASVAELEVVVRYMKSGA